MKKKSAGNKGKRSRKKAKASAAPEKNGPTAAAVGLPVTAGVSRARSCRHLPGACQFPAVSVSRRLPSPANFSGPITLARLLGTRGANWPGEFERTPFRPGRPREMGLVSALAWVVSSPVLGVPRMVRRIARGVRDAASREPSPAEELLALRMKLETGDITDAEFQRERARVEAAGPERTPETPPAKRTKQPKRKRRKENGAAC